MILKMIAIAFSMYFICGGMSVEKHRAHSRIGVLYAFGAVSLIHFQDYACDGHRIFASLLMIGLDPLFARKGVNFLWLSLHCV